jgi:hypothetical protein
MSMLMDTVMYRSKVWVGPDFQEFHVNDILVRDGDLWVEYVNTATRETYSCKLEAFADRFTMKEKPQ